MIIGWTLCLLTAPYPFGAHTVMRQGAAYPEVLWTFDVSSNSYGGAAVGDIDGDGKLEVVFGTYMGDEHFYALNAEDGSVLWEKWAGPGPLDASVKIVDVNGDGALEVCFATSGAFGSGAGVLHVLDGATGEVCWEYDPGRCTDSPPAIADIDADGQLEILYGTFRGSTEGAFVHVLNARNGSLDAKIGPFNGYIQSGPAVVDLDCDEQLDVVIAMFAGDNQVYAINGSDYSELWSFQTGDSMYHGCSFADLDEDGKPEVVIGSYDEHVYAINGEDGSLCWSYHGANAYFITSIADLDSDGRFEVIASGTYVLTVLAWNGSKLWEVSSGGSFRGASIADIDGNGELDVVFGGSNGVVQVLRGMTGDLLWGFNAAADAGRSVFEIDHGPVIADLDSDGKCDIFFVGGRGYSTDPENNYGRAYALRAGTGTGKGWYMFRHDYHNSGCFHHETMNGTLVGTVIDFNSHLPIMNAEVYVNAQVLYTDVNGCFSISLAQGPYAVMIVKQGYYSNHTSITITAGTTQTLSVMLLSPPPAFVLIAPWIAAIVISAVVVIGVLFLRKKRAH